MGGERVCVAGPRGESTIMWGAGGRGFALPMPLLPVPAAAVAGRPSLSCVCRHAQRPAASASLPGLPPGHCQDQPQCGREGHQAPRKVAQRLWQHLIRRSRLVLCVHSTDAPARCRSPRAAGVQTACAPRPGAASVVRPPTAAPSPLPPALCATIPLAEACLCVRFLPLLTCSAPPGPATQQHVGTL